MESISSPFYLKRKQYPPYLCVSVATPSNVIKIRVFHHEEHEVHEGVYEEILSFLRVLRALRGEIFLSFP